MMPPYRRFSGFPCRPGPCCNTPWQPVQAALHRVVRGDAHAGGGAHLHGLRHSDHLRLPPRLSPSLEDREVPHRQGEGGTEGEREATDAQHGAIFQHGLGLASHSLEEEKLE